MKILELTLLTNNLGNCKSFYQGAMGFQLMDENEGSVTFAIGTSILKFELCPVNHNPKYHFALNIPTNKMDEAIIWMIKRTSLIQIEKNTFNTYFENWKAKAIFFYDDQGNILEFICRDDLKNESEEAFCVESILNISEVGLVAEEPLLMANEIIRKTKSEFFPKGPKRIDFCAVGTESGLFVISNPKRNWFPTQELAQKWKVKAKVEVDDLEYDLEFN